MNGLENDILLAIHNRDNAKIKTLFHDWNKNKNTWLRLIEYGYISVKCLNGIQRISLTEPGLNVLKNRCTWIK